jgi:hypothetical protein
MGHASGPSRTGGAVTACPNISWLPPGITGAEASVSVPCREAPSASLRCAKNIWKHLRQCLAFKIKIGACIGHCRLKARVTQKLADGPEVVLVQRGRFGSVAIIDAG